MTRPTRVRWSWRRGRLMLAAVQALDAGWHPPGRPDRVRRFYTPLFRRPGAVGCALIMGKWQFCAWWLLWSPDALRAFPRAPCGHR